MEKQKPETKSKEPGLIKIEKKVAYVWQMSKLWLKLRGSLGSQDFWPQKYESGKRFQIITQEKLEV